jgi:hypothetical protein
LAQRQSQPRQEGILPGWHFILGIRTGIDGRARGHNVTACPLCSHQVGIQALLDQSPQPPCIQPSQRDRGHCRAGYAAEHSTVDDEGVDWGHIVSRTSPETDPPSHRS